MNEQLLLLISKQLEEINAMLLKQQRIGKVQGKTGRPSKKYIVMRYRKAHPNGKKMECARVMGISIKTVSKYWDICMLQNEQIANTLCNANDNLQK